MNLKRQNNQLKVNQVKNNQLKGNLSSDQMANLSNHPKNKKTQLISNKILEVSEKSLPNLRRTTNHQKREMTN